MEQFFANYGMVTASAILTAVTCYWAVRILRHPFDMTFDTLLDNWARVVVSLAVVLLTVAGAYRWHFWRVSEATITRVHSAPDADRALLLVHGWHGSAESWVEVLQFFKSIDVLSQTDVFLIDYPIVTSTSGNGIERYASDIAKFAAEQRFHYRHWTFVAHSLGGVLARKAIIDWRLVDPTATPTLITLGSPLAGTDLARGALEFLKVPADVISHIQIDAPFIISLAKDWRLLRASGGGVHYCVASTGDAIVPLKSALFLCDRCAPLSGVSHGRLVSVGDASNAQAEAMRQAFAQRTAKCTCQQSGAC